MTRLKNLEFMYGRQKIRIRILAEENKILKQKIVLLEAKTQEQQKTIDDLKLQMEELKKIVFGKRRNKDNDHFDPPAQRIQRTAESYRRPIPDDGQVTEIKRHRVDACPVCQTQTTLKRISSSMKKIFQFQSKRLF